MEHVIMCEQQRGYGCVAAALMKTPTHTLQLCNFVRCGSCYCNLYNPLMWEHKITNN